MLFRSGGAAVTRNITFTASPQFLCGTNITATVTHVDGSNNLGNVVYTIPTGVNGAPATASYTTPAIAIPDNTAAGVNVPLDVTGVTGTIADVNFRIDGTLSSSDPLSTTVGLNHSYVGDLKFKLTSPQGTTVEIMTAGGGSADCAANNIYQMTLDDQAAGPMTCPAGGDGGGPLTGSFTPSNPLSAFNGQDPNGTWTLNVSDIQMSDVGSIRAYSLVIVGKTCCGGLPTPTRTPTPTPTPSPTPLGTPTPTPPPTACSFGNGTLNPQLMTESGVVGTAGFWSEIQHNTGNTTVSNASSGFGAIQGGNRLADNFTLAQPCTINSVSFYGYLTGGGATPSPFTAYTLQIWNGRPGDAGSIVIFGDATTNRLASSVDTGSFRIFNTVVPPPGSSQGTTRRIWRNTVTVATLLQAGTYWLDWASTVTGGANHFHPAKTIPGTRGATGDNARQFDVGTAVWSDVLDAGSPATPPSVPQDFPFDINGVGTGTVTVSGRVFASDGSHGLRSVSVSLIDSNGVVRTATTSSFGFYSFDNVTPGRTYTIRVSSRLYRFVPLTMAINDNLTNADFVGLE